MMEFTNDDGRSRYMDDGVVNVGSANPPGIGALRQQVVPEDHTSIWVIQGLLR